VTRNKEVIFKPFFQRMKSGKSHEPLFILLR